MEYHARALHNVEVYNADSRHYDPPGKFDGVFSSFSDHHIRPSDKARYFANIVRNLNPDGVFICGDEFLPAHEEGDQKMLEAALYAYHNHIISIAEHKGQTKLAELERAALQSGLDGKGDFKVTCDQYESFLKKHKLRWHAVKIGPHDHADGEDGDVGGVYVYSAEHTGTRSSFPSRRHKPASP